MQLFASVMLFERKREWVELLHQMILVAAENLAVCPNSARSEKVLERIKYVIENSGEYLFQMNQTLLTEYEVMSLNADFTVLVVLAANTSDATRVKAKDMKCYTMLKRVLVYALKYGLSRQQVRIDFSAYEKGALQVCVPSHYEMEKQGVYILTPVLFREDYDGTRASWNLEEEMKRVGDIQCRNPFVDVVCRFLVWAVSGESEQRLATNIELFQEFVSVFRTSEGADPIKIFDDATRSYAQLVLLAVLQSMCRQQPVLYDECVKNRLGEELTKESFLVKIDTKEFEKREEEEHVVCRNSAITESDLVTIKGGSVVAS